MAAETDQTLCPHCTCATPTPDAFCVHCGGFLAMDTVLLAESCRVSTADGARFKVDGSVLLMTYRCYGDSGESTPVTIAVQAKHVSGLRSALLDEVVRLSVDTKNGGNEHDENSKG